jgi:ectoine hydroxylase-related dioxygenase (phytanoyl-CoA dioxygenase family)
MENGTNVASLHEYPLSGLAENGFAILPDVIGSTELENLQGLSEDPTIKRSRAGARHMLSNSMAAQIASDVRMLGIARTVFGQEAFPFRATLFDKTQAANWLVAWHQDTALPLQERQEVAGWGPWSVKDDVHYAHAPACALEQVLALRLHLDDSTCANGPLRVLPGTHRLDMLSDAAIHELTAGRRAVECVVGAGGVIAMCPLLVHASSKSVSAAPRRVLHVEYAATPRIAYPLKLAVV